MTSTDEKKVSQLIFGGTFDPFHLGHLSICQHIANELALKQITLLPANIPPHKSAASVSAKHRLAMLQALAKQEALFTIDGRELTRNKPSYTADTLAEMYAEQPHLAISLLIGMDSLLSFTRWHQWQAIIAQVNLVVCTRPNYQLALSQLDIELRQRLTSKASFDLTKVGQIYLAPAINMDIASSQLRPQLSLPASSPLHAQARAQLPNAIRQYIDSHSLYL